jgi:hypothetical protein
MCVFKYHAFIFPVRPPRWRCKTYTVTTSVYDNQCTYLNSSLLVIPCEYVLHGLVLGIDWTPFWPLLTSIHLVATANPVFNCLWHRFKFHPNVFCYLVGFSRMSSKHHNDATRYRAHSIHHTSITIHVLLYTSSILLGRLAVLHSLCPLQVAPI